MITRDLFYSENSATYSRSVPAALTADLAFVAVNYHLRHLKVMRAFGGRFDKITPGGNSILHAVVAHAAVPATCWMAFNHRSLGIPLDLQDKFLPLPPEYNRCAPSSLDIGDRFNWMRGPHLRNTALLLALKKGRQHVDITMKDYQTMGLAIDALLRANAKTNLQDGCGNTGLHIAALHRDLVSIVNLRSKGARADIENNAGLKPVDLLDVRYQDINPFLYQQTGGDTNCYIHTLAPYRSWCAAGKPALQLLRA